MPYLSYVDSDGMLAFILRMNPVRKPKATNFTVAPMVAASYEACFKCTVCFSLMINYLIFHISSYLQGMFSIPISYQTHSYLKLICFGAISYPLSLPPMRLILCFHGLSSDSYWIWLFLVGVDSYTMKRHNLIVSGRWTISLNIKHLQAPLQETLWCH